MSLKEINSKASYDSDEDDILNEFYIPALSESFVYKRLAGFFTSNSLAIAAKGIAKFITNGGKIQLIANVVLSKEDYEKIREITEGPFIEEAEKNFIEDLENIEDELIKNHVKMLGWMLKNGKLEIKISLVSEGTGIQHQKTGILEDSKSNIVSFSGSDNETKGGWIDNIENFHVFCSWKEDDQEHIKADLSRFEKFWEDKAKRAKVFSISEAVKQKLIRIAPENDEEFEELSKGITEELLERNKEARLLKKRSKTNEPPKLRTYQEEAIKKWIDNGYSGIVEMATGTGKTNVAISCLKYLANKHPDNLLVVIGCPTKVLVSQWRDILRKYIDGFEVIITSQKETKDSIYRSIINESQNNHIIIGAYASLSKPWFTDIIIERYKGKILFIADEAHWLGAENFSKALSNRYLYRLGLTATPIRYFDEEGTKKLLDYFREVVFRYSLKEAIRDGWLTPYDYYMFFAYLTEGEVKEYQKLTKKYIRSIHAGKGVKKENDFLTLILAQRARIVKKATNKINVFEKILQKLNDENKLNSLLIYVEDGEQLSAYLDIMNKFSIEYRKIDDTTKDKDREIILGDLSENKIDCVIAMKVLDEGVDIKRLSRAIFISSSGNSKQFIQRRGRILRKAEGKKVAEIYDICVLVDTEKQKDKEFEKIEEKITAGEFKRLAIFSISAYNKVDCYTELERIGKSLNIDIYKIINEIRRYAE